MYSRSRDRAFDFVAQTPNAIVRRLRGLPGTSTQNFP